MKKRWFLAPVATAIVAVSVVTGGVALAQEDGASGTPVVSSFASRVAAILGIDETQVQDAMKQARQEMRDEAVQNKLDAMVAQGRLTQEQADSYLEWYKSRPDDIPGFRGLGFGFGRHGHGFGHGFGHGMRQQESWQSPAPAPSSGSSGGAEGASL